MNIAFIGLGNMGLPIARNLCKAGHALTVYNRTKARADELVTSGARVADTPAEAAAQVDVVLTMLSDDAALDTIVFGESGILNGRATPHIGLSTISIAMAKRLTEQQKAYISCPVFGRPDAAASAKLNLVAAGDAALIEKFRPLFDAIGQKLFVAGDEPWQANLVKLSGNFTLAAMMETLSESFALIRKAGVDPKLFLEIIAGNVYRSPVYQNYGSAMVEQRFESAGFKLKLGLKDVTLALAAGSSIEVPMPLASVVRDQLLSGVARGLGELDWAGLSRIAAENAGLKG